MKEILTIMIFIGSVLHVDGPSEGITMINFTGKAVGSHFQGEIQSGGVDVQKHKADTTFLSARYMLSGIDATGKPCCIYIQNEATTPSYDNLTHPTIVTDSRYIDSIAQGPLVGKIESVNEQLIIRIFTTH